MTQNVKKRVLSGIRPTNKLHIGNYLGAVKGMIDLQNDPNYETFYMVADLHALTTPYDKDELKTSRRAFIIDYLAAGLDPEKSVLFIQSMVPGHTELAFYLSSMITVARLQHLPTFKEKVKQHPQNVTIALLNYPVLMASDILAYKAHAVPVGLDQEPHLEVSREIARKLNDTYGTDFPEPVRFVTEGEYIPSLLGEGKMSKSVDNSFIMITDDLDTIKARLAKVPTDSGKGEVVPPQGSVANLLKFVELFEGKDSRQAYERAYLAEGIRYKELKENLSLSIYEYFKPFNEKRNDIASNPSYVDRVISEGAQKADAVVADVLINLKTAMGVC